MRAVSSEQRAVEAPHAVWLICLLLTAYCSHACKLPSLESPQCNEASLAVKQFYSFHLGNDMTPSPENLKIRERFLTSDLYNSLSGNQTGTKDYFTNSDSYPKTFKIGACTAPDADHTNVQVQIYWQQEHESTKDITQRAVMASTVKTGDHWLINNVAETDPK